MGDIAKDKWGTDAVNPQHLTSPLSTGKGFKQNNNLKLHVKIHMGETISLQSL